MELDFDTTMEFVFLRRWRGRSGVRGNQGWQRKQNANGKEKRDPAKTKQKGEMKVKKAKFAFYFIIKCSCDICCFTWLKFKEKKVAHMMKKIQNNNNK